MTHVWKLGERCYHDFELGTVREMEKDKVSEIHYDSGMCISGQDLRDSMVIITQKTKEQSELFQKYKKILISETNCGLNHPRIHGYLVENWMIACKGDKKEITFIHGCIKAFIFEVQKVMEIRIQGISIPCSN